MWSVYERVKSSTDRTNNHAESAHRRMQSELGADYPPLWTFIDSLNTVQKGRDSVYEDYVSGDTPLKKMRKYQEADERIKRIVDS